MGNWKNNQNSVKNEDNDVINYVAVFTDITEIKQSQSELNFLAHHDALTSLPNRLFFNQKLEKALNHAKRIDSKLAILFIDLDRFKNINDSFGHTAGDHLLMHLWFLGKEIRSFKRYIWAHVLN